jgi:NAD(P)-dependent dehydrogenase (short-subunit alcohol dehydrogenase family)
MENHSSRGLQPEAHSINRRNVLRSAAVAAALFGAPFRRSVKADNPHHSVVPEPVYFPTNSGAQEISLNGKHVVITGASRGIGRATAIELVSAGAQVWGTSRTPAAYPGITEYPLLPLNLEDPASIAAFVSAVGAATGGRIDVLINNAGRFVFGSTTPLAADPALFALWSANTALGLQTLYLGHRMVTAGLLGFMQQTGYRRVMFTASANAYISGADIGSEFYQPYVAGKRSLLDFANSLSTWLGLIGLDIGVGTVNPASTHTDLAVGTRPIFTEPVDANGNPAAGSPLSAFLPVIRAAVANAQPPGVVARAYRQLLQMKDPPPNVLAVIPNGPNSTADAADLPLLLSALQKEMESGAIHWVPAKGD